MMEEITENKTGLDLTSRSLLSKDDDIFTSKSFSALVAGGNIPYIHKKIANNYVIVKRVFRFQAVSSRINASEKALLMKYDFNTLEFTTVKQMIEELELLQKWSLSENLSLREDADNLIEIRAKELKFISASHYAGVSNEIYRGYVALENYFNEISKYR